MAVLHVDLARLRNLVEVPGEPVWPERPPYQALMLRQRGLTDWVLSPAVAGTDEVDLVGDLVLPCELASGGFESVFLGRLQLPPPFVEDDLATLRSSSDDLRILMRINAVGEGRFGLTAAALRAAAGTGLDVNALIDLSWAVVALRQWPRRQSRQTETYPAGIMRGLPDEPATFREAAASRIAIVDGQPVQSVRHIVGPIPWTSARLRSLLLEAAGELEKAKIATQLVEEIHQLAMLALPRGRRPDAARSAWPQKFRIAWDAALALLTVPSRAPGRGEEFQPLQPAWSLYQDWVAIEVIRAICTAHGPFVAGGSSSPLRLRPRGEIPLLGWVTDECVIDLWVTPAIGTESSPRHLDDIYAANLTPDIVIVRRPLSAIDELGICPPEELKTIIIDAKRYSGPSQAPGVLSRGTVASEASKYLWALRSSGANHRHAIDQLILISPGGGPIFSTVSRTEVVSARPGKSDELVSILCSYL